MESDTEWNAAVTKDIRREFRKEFLIFITLIIVEIFLTILFSILYLSFFHADKLLDFNVIYQDVIEFGAEEAFRINELPEGVSIEILNDDNQIVDGYNTRRPSGYQYTQKEINMFLNNLYMDVYAYYPEDETELFVLFFVPTAHGELSADVFITSVGFFLVLVFLTIHVLSQRLGKKFLEPLNELVLGVRKIKKGDYRSKITYVSHSEFDQVRDAINALSTDLDLEIKKRQAVENSRNQLIVDVSHDLKTPLTNVIGYSEVILRNLQKSPHLDKAHMEMQRYLEIISKNGKQANRLLQDLSELSQLQVPDLCLHCQEVDFPESIRTFLIDCIPEIEEAGFLYEFQIPEKAFTCEIDTYKFQRALQNLIDNALKYNPPGTHITIVVSDEDQNVKLTVQDNGVGIPKESRDKIFEPFVRADQDRNRTTGGSGLGLAITKKIIEKHGGTIALKSDESGSRFEIELPKHYSLCRTELEIER